MSQNNKIKSNLEGNYGENLRYEAKNLTKAYDKELKRYVYKSTDVAIKNNSDSIKICNIKKNKEKPLFSLCIKHTFVTRATDYTVPRIDSCRVLCDPAKSHALLSFANPGIANEFENKISRDRELYNTKYANISYFVVVTNTVNEIIKKSASVCISGLTTGRELKIWIEKEFNFKEIYMPKYVLQLIIDNNTETIRDDIPVLMLYEHMYSYWSNSFCSMECFLSSKSPVSPLNIQISLNVVETKVKTVPDLGLYSIEEKWGASMMPNWLMRLLSDLYFYGPLYEGVFRLSGKDSSLTKWYKHMLYSDDFLITEDIYNKAAILKYFIRKIKGSIMTKNNKKDLNNLCKKLVKVSAEHFLKNEKKNSKLVRMIQELPKTHLFLLQNILVVIQALTSSEKTLFNPFSIARAISPSIFPLMSLSHWKCGTKLFEAIILLTDTLISDSTRQTILDNYTLFRQNTENPDSVFPDLQSGESCSGSISTAGNSELKHSKVDTEEEKELFESDSELDSTDEENSMDDSSISDGSVSAYQNENLDFVNSDCPMLSVEEPLISPQNVTVSNISPNTEPDLYCSNGPEGDNLTEDSPDSEDLEAPKKICMGMKMKEIHRRLSKLTGHELLVDSENLKTDRHSTLKSDKISMGLQKKSLIKPINSSEKPLNRSTSFIGTSHRFPRGRENDDSSRLKPGNQVLRKNSRKALATVEESNNSNADLNHRSRSPNVKSLIKLYEEKNKAPLEQTSRRNSRIKDELETRLSER